MIQRLLVFIVLLSSVSLAQPAAGPPGHPPLISVNGKGEFWVAPDQIEFSVHLASEDLQPQAAMAANQSLLDKLRHLLSNFSVETGTFQVTDVTLEHPYRNGSRLKTWEVSRDCAFTLANVKDKERLLMAFAGGSLGEVRSARATLKDPISVRAKARLQALQEAQKKAQVMASSLQQTVGKAYWIEEVTPEFWSNPSANIVTRAPGEDQASGLGMIKISATVRVAFLLH